MCYSQLCPLTLLWMNLYWAVFTLSVVKTLWFISKHSCVCIFKGVPVYFCLALSSRTSASFICTNNPKTCSALLEALTVWWDSTCPLFTILAAWMSEQLQSSHGLHELYSRQMKWVIVYFKILCCELCGQAVLPNKVVCSVAGARQKVWEQEASELDNPRCQLEPSGFTSPILVIESFIPQRLSCLDCAVALKRSRCSVPFSSSFSVTSWPSLAVECFIPAAVIVWVVGS